MIVDVPIHLIQANPWQVRRRPVEDEYIIGLAADIAANGLLQFPVGRFVKEDGTPLTLQEASSLPTAQRSREWVQLAFGHNRWKAFDYNRLHRSDGSWRAMQVNIKVLTDEQMAAQAWAENEKRKDVTPIERAEAIEKMIADFGWTQEKVGERLGISRSAVTNLLRMLGAPEGIKEGIEAGEISQRQALAILPTAEAAEANGSEKLQEEVEEMILAAKEGASAEAIRERGKEAVRQSELKMAAQELRDGEMIDKWEMKRRREAVKARATAILADRFDADDPKAWRMLLRHIDMDYRHNTRNWKLPSLRVKVAMKLIEPYHTDNADPAEIYMEIRDKFKAVGMDIPTYEEMVETDEQRESQYQPVGKVRDLLDLRVREVVHGERAETFLVVEGPRESLEALMGKEKRQPRNTKKLALVLAELVNKAEAGVGTPQRYELRGGLRIDMMLGIDGVLRMQASRVRVEPSEKEWETTLKHLPEGLSEGNVQRLEHAGRMFIRCELK